MKLLDVYSDLDAAEPILWQLLQERPPEANISHRKMPSWNEHLAFIAGKPYAHWYLIDVGETDYVGAAYLTHAREIGIGILNRYQGFQYGRTAVKLLMERHPGRCLANVAPTNYKSQQMFRDLGGKVIQFTFELKETA
jgi:RimJ/RimL family protein N-acetyltransferase